MAIYAQELDTAFDVAVEWQGRSGSDFSRERGGEFRLGGDPNTAYVRALDEVLNHLTGDIALRFERILERARQRLEQYDDPDVTADALGFSVRDRDFTINRKTGLVTGLLADEWLNAGLVAIETPLFDMQWDSGRVMLYVTHAELTGGSIKISLSSVFKTTGVILGLILAAASSPIHTEWKQDSYIEQVIEGTTCRTQLSFDIDASGLRELVPQELDWTSAPTPQAERYRICRLQFALRLSGYDPGSLDGVIGEKTEDAWARFGRDKGHDDVSMTNTIILRELANSAAEWLLKS